LHVVYWRKAETVDELIASCRGPRNLCRDEAAAEWLRNQSVGIYPLKSTTPETIIHELEKVFDVADGGQGQGVVRFQPVARMNAVMAVTLSEKLLERATQWVQRLDRSNNNGTTVRIYQLNFGNATKIAKILNDIFVGRSGTNAETPANQLAPGTNATASRLDALSAGGAGAPAGGASSSSGGAQPMGQGAGSGQQQQGVDFNRLRLVCRALEPVRQQRRGIEREHAAAQCDAERANHSQYG
jgi:general secretion pathway protein D